MGQNINRVVLTGNLTRDPELHEFRSGASVCSLRIATNTLRKVGEEWQTKANYFDVLVWNGRGENVARHLRKGRKVAIDGRLEWREYTTDDGYRRQTVEIVADNVEFLTPPPKTDEPAPVTDPELAAVGAPAADDDIPF